MAISSDWDLIGVGACAVYQLQQAVRVRPISAGAPCYLRSRSCLTLAVHLQLCALLPRDQFPALLEVCSEHHHLLLACCTFCEEHTLPKKKKK